MASSYDEWSDTDEEAMAKLGVSVLDYNNEVSEESNSQKYTLECDRILRQRWESSDQYCHKYLTISDFAKQHWCEQQHLYSLAPDIYLMRALPGEEVDIQDSQAAKKIKAKGTEIHKSKELEVCDQVEVKIETKEDRWAVRLINLQAAVNAFLSGQTVAREVPVFGSPFGSDIFLFGIIDELRYDPDLHKVTISELKTRTSKYSPKTSQQKKDRYQVSLYAQVFNEMAKGSVSVASVTSHLGVDLHIPLSEEVALHVNASRSGGGHQGSEVVTLSELLNDVLAQVQALTLISSARVEYIHQDTQDTICLEEFVIDEQLLRFEFMDHVAWWTGSRGTRGVDVEDCWKCGFCVFQPLCEWREHMAGKMADKANQLERGVVCYGSDSVDTG